MKTLRFVDAHIHLSDEEYAEKVEDIISEAKSSNVVALVSNSMDLETSIRSLELATRYKAKGVYAALGIHPWSVNNLTGDALQQTCEFIIEQRLNKAVVAIGEVGLDYKYEKIWDKQLKVFDEMLKLAEKMELPVIIHSRGTTAKIVEMLPSYRLKKVLLHWFSNPISVLSKAIDHGYYISEGPPVAYSEGIREVVRRVPLENLLTETDGPVRYFKSPFNGKLTSPAFLPTVVNAIAEVKKKSVVEVAEQILKNFEEFFGLKLNLEEVNA
ncbi:MAG: TatD family hydrolase [Candidatus Bathyarchaeia archaeon]|nr:TatD family hydrolase [Candidatus Bathyarchaeota archaeon]